MYDPDEVDEQKKKINSEQTGYKTVHLRYDKYKLMQEKLDKCLTVEIPELSAEAEKYKSLFEQAEDKIGELTAVLVKYGTAIMTLIKERDAAINDMYGVEESVLYACEYCAYDHCTGDCKHFRWRGVKR